jgi:hypothetical protein
MPKEVDAVTKLYDFLLWMIPKIKKFLRSQKFVIGDRIENMMLDILELLIKVAYSKNKHTVLKAANFKLEQLRYLIRLSKALKLINLKGYEFCAGLVALRRTSGRGIFYEFV